MTSAHIFFIPTIFLLGLMFGGLIARKSGPRMTATASGAPSHDLAVTTDRPSSWRAPGLAFALVVTVFVATHMISDLNGPMALRMALDRQPLFDQRPSFSAAEVYGRLDEFGDVGRAMYQRFTYSADVMFPLTLLVFLLLLARHTADRRLLGKSARSAMLALPMTWFLADMSENAMVFALITQFPERSELLAATLGVVTVIKFGLLLACVLVPALVTVLPQRSGAVLGKGEVGPRKPGH